METIKNTLKAATGKDAQSSQSQSQFEKGEGFPIVFTVLSVTNHNCQAMKYRFHTKMLQGNNII